MIGQLPAVERLDLAAAPAVWRDTLARVAAGEARALLERDGRTLAALISAADYHLFVEWDTQRRVAQAALQASWDAFAGVSEEELEREIKKALAEARAELHDRRGSTAQSA